MAGEVRLGTCTDKDTRQSRETRDIVADNVGASLKFTGVSVERAPKAAAPDAHASGPISAPASYAEPELLANSSQQGRESSYSRPPRRLQECWVRPAFLA